MSQENVETPRGLTAATNCETVDPEMEVALSGSWRRLAVAVAVAALGAASWLLLGPSGAGGGGGTAQASHGKPLDHFVCYRPFVGQLFHPSTPVGVNITLKDQFAQQPVAHKVGAPRVFCNPARKDHPGVGNFPIVHPNNHLTLYRLDGRVPLKRLRVNNQFQSATSTSPPNLVTDPGTARHPKRPRILVPTRKLPHPPVASVDHFKCYPVERKAINQDVFVQDQFDSNGENTTVFIATLICNPAAKRHGTRTFRIQHPNQHLVCYTITPAGLPIEGVQIRNQFGPRQLTGNTDQYLLCVPSRTTVVP